MKHQANCSISKTSYNIFYNDQKELILIFSTICFIEEHQNVVLWLNLLLNRDKTNTKKNIKAYWKNNKFGSGRVITAAIYMRRCTVWRAIQCKRVFLQWGFKFVVVRISRHKFFTLEFQWYFFCPILHYTWTCEDWNGSYKHISVIVLYHKCVFYSSKVIFIAIIFYHLCWVFCLFYG